MVLGNVDIFNASLFDIDIHSDMRLPPVDQTLWIVERKRIFIYLSHQSSSHPHPRKHARTHSSWFMQWKDIPIYQIFCLFVFAYATLKSNEKLIQRSATSQWYTVYTLYISASACRWRMAHETLNNGHMECVFRSILTLYNPTSCRNASLRQHSGNDVRPRYPLCHAGFLSDGKCIVPWSPPLFVRFRMHATAHDDNSIPRHE